MLTDYQTLVVDLIRDDAARIATTERDRAITAAVERYSKDRPKVAVEDLTPTGANTVPLPAGWVTDFSTLRALEYPVGNVPPTMIDTTRYSFYQTPSAEVIQVVDSVAVTAGSVRATYTIKHTVSGVADTIPLGDREPVACWAAAILCDELAAFYSGGTDSTIQADSVEGRSKAQEYSARAKALRKRYLDELGVDDKRSQPAGAVVELKRPDSWGGPRLNHPALNR